METPEAVERGHVLATLVQIEYLGRAGKCECEKWKGETEGS
jgi:hypothetical protein